MSNGLIHLIQGVDCDLIWQTSIKKDYMNSWHRDRHWLCRPVRKTHAHTEDPTLGHITFQKSFQNPAPQVFFIFIWPYYSNKNDF